MAIVTMDGEYELMCD